MKLENIKVGMQLHNEVLGDVIVKEISIRKNRILLDILNKEKAEHYYTDKDTPYYPFGLTVARALVEPK